MLFCAVLAGIMVWAMSWGRCPDWASAGGAVLCTLAFGAFALGHRHTHSEFIAIDYYAQQSRLFRFNPGLKTIFLTSLLILCVAADSALTAVVIFLSMALFTVVAGGTRIRVYLSLMTVPAVFILLSGLALVFDFASQPAGVFSLRLLGGYLCVTPAAQAHAFLVTVKALGAVSCLYALSLSTPMNELIGVMRRIHLPAVVIELMYLIYRYIFILLAAYAQIRAAASARLGFAGARNSVRTFGRCCANLLVQSFRRAGACFDAMESRCYEGKLAFLQSPKPVRAAEAAAAGVYFCAVTALAVLTRI